MLVNKKNCKAYALEMATKRYHKFTRLGSETYVWLDNLCKNHIEDLVMGLPSKGKTIQPWSKDERKES